MSYGIGLYFSSAKCHHLDEPSLERFLSQTVPEQLGWNLRAARETYKTWLSLLNSNYSFLCATQ